MVSSTQPHILIEIRDQNDILITTKRLGISSTGVGDFRELFPVNFDVPDLNLTLSFEQTSIDTTKFNTELLDKSDEIVFDRDEDNIFNLIDFLIKEASKK
jgi:hypothetical protein